ncbi:hypothetical protein N7495_009115 [Penicillium taxi]|uniref:uncharacterized protein n=1 Tax=Penicillium taxi TaxID=168475 RepID=UPI002544E55A|nr:uncharacterized protein N7495_009115 [Penicillium taxi]KAJ5889074.1 hypothetical protein N7495_009115 [Penicillium taxi]
MQTRVSQRLPNANPLPYTASPFKLLWDDICLGLQCALSLPGLFSPLRLGQTHKLDEAYPSVRNYFCIAVHIYLLMYQFFFLLFIPLLILLTLPTTWILLYITIGISYNYLICLFLNGFQRVLVSQVPVPDQSNYARERWFFINGVACGRYWLQANIDQLSYTFGRRVTGIHNFTCGIIFDLIECLIQRCFCYSTCDIRIAYALVQDALLAQDCDKVVLTLHSQGGIEGGLAIDWLLDALPQDLLHQLEVYTFGNAANHFNNPRRTWRADYAKGSSTCQTSNRSAVGYIEHYANAGDPVSMFGVLYFSGVPNRYLGRLFVRQGSGHLMNQHYLDTMFTLGPDHRVLDSNKFMDMEIELESESTEDERDIQREETLVPVFVSKYVGQNAQNGHQVLRVKDLSHLWLYRNGGHPAV